jgi:hypothetical protein
MSGGFITGVPFTGAAAKNLVAESYRSATNSWFLNLLNGTGGPSSGTVIADCVKGKLPTASSGAGSPIPISMGVGTAIATCTGKKSAVTGGFSQPGFTGAPANFFFFYQSVREGKNWRVSGAKIGGGALAPVSNAYCAA